MAAFALGVTPDDIPPEVLAQAARLVADTLACGVGAVDGERSRCAAKVRAKFPGAGDACG
jgi:2-methylcitrate dehydratase PrpD